MNKKDKILILKVRRARLIRRNEKDRNVNIIKKINREISKLGG